MPLTNRISRISRLKADASSLEWARVNEFWCYFAGYHERSDLQIHVPEGLRDTYRRVNWVLDHYGHLEN